MTEGRGLTAGGRWWLAVAGLSVLALLACIVVVLLLVGDPLASLTPLGGITFAVVGALLVARRPDNTVSVSCVSRM